MLAIEHNRLDILRVLYRNGAPLHFVTATGHTQLHLAVGAERPDFVEFFLTNGVDANCTNGGGWTALHSLPLSMVLTIHQKDYEIAELLLTHGGTPYETMEAWEFAHSPFERVIISGDTNLMALYLKYIPRTNLTPHAAEELLALSRTWNPDHKTRFLSNAIASVHQGGGIKEGRN